MCGIVGGTRYTADSMNTALETIAHRGRDASNVQYYPGGVWFGHNRLSIQDLSSAADQPFNLRGISVVFNGELWARTLTDYAGLRQQGNTTSDTELLVLMYERYGHDLVDFAQRLDGMFAFAIHDTIRGRVVIARDMLGRVPLYIVNDARGMVFASEAKAITGVLNERYGGAGSRAGRYGSVALFPPGYIMTYDVAGGATAGRQFASFDVYKGIGEAEDMGLEYYANGIRERLQAAVVNELVADVPVCTILSGGIDSTIITAIMAKHVPRLRAFTVSVGESNGKDDLAYARLAAEAIGVPLTEVILPGPDYAVSKLGEAVWAVEDARWVQVAPAVPQIALAHAIGAAGYKVVFGGEGSDELFASYNDVKRWSWQPDQYRARRIQLCERLHDNNLIRGNKAMMFGGTVELRTPFLDLPLVDFCLRIPVCHRSNKDGYGPVMKPVLREAFRGWVPEKLLMRPKVAFQDGAHSVFLKDYKDTMRELFDKLFLGATAG